MSNPFPERSRETARREDASMGRVGLPTGRPEGGHRVPGAALRRTMIAPSHGEGGGGRVNP